MSASKKIPQPNTAHPPIASAPHAPNGFGATVVMATASTRSLLLLLFNMLFRARPARAAHHK